MHIGHVDVLYEILIPLGSALHSHSSSGLGPVFGERSPLDIAKVGNGHHHVLVRIEVLRIEFIRRHRDFGTSCIAILLLHAEGLILDDSHLHFVAAEHVDAVFDELHQFIVFSLQFLPLESGELPEPHFHDCRSLNLGETEPLLEGCPGVLSILGGLDDGYDFIYDIQSLEQTFQDVGAGLGLLEVELGPAHNHLVSEIHEMPDYILEAQCVRTTSHESHIVN